VVKKQAKKQPKKRARRGNWVLIGAGAVLAAVAVAAFFAFTGGGDSAPKRRSARVTPVTTDAQQVTVDVVDNDFKPASLQIKKGATITWQFKGKVPHTVTEEPGSEAQPFDSGAKGSGEFAHTFDAAGTFYYYCVIHHVMQGTVVVTE
jgi:plastocyanin